jgi:hypothetical protein
MSKAWANPVWFFFHGLAEKVHEDFYNRNKNACLSLVKRVCNILPCPLCRREATKYMSRISVLHVPTKEHFKEMLFHFHNSVNKKLHKSSFPKSGLEKYSRLRFIKTTRVMCSQLRRFNQRWLGGRGVGAGNIEYINLIENSVRKHITHFL